MKRRFTPGPNRCTSPRWTTFLIREQPHQRAEFRGALALHSETAAGLYCAQSDPTPRPAETVPIWNRFRVLPGAPRVCGTSEQMLRD